MEVLLITPHIPYPLTEGGKISQYAVIDYQRKIHKITLVLVAYSVVELEYIFALQKLLPEVEIKTLNYALEYKDNIITIIKNKVKNAINSRKKSNIRTYISDLDNPSNTNFPPTKNRDFIENLFQIVSERAFDIIQVDHTAFIDLVYLLPKNIKKVFVHHEIHFARLESSISKSQNEPFFNYILNHVRDIEKTFLSQYNAVFVFSENDRQKLLEIGLKNIYNTPFSVLDKYFIPISKKDSVVTKLVFIGGEEHAPNKDAVEWYIKDIAPLVEKFTDAKLQVIGKWNKTTIDKLNKNNVVEFCGYVEDIISYCKNSIMVVPVRIGSGIRTKILYAMAQGVPVVSASIGCEGIPVENNKSIVIADTPIDFANGIKKLFVEPKFCFNLIIEAQTLAKKHYSQEAVASLRNELYKEVLLQVSNA